MPRPARAVTGGAPAAEVGNSGLRRMLIAIAQRPGLTNRQLGVRAGISSMTAQDEPLWTAEDVAGYLKISLTTVYDLARRRELPGVRIGVQWQFNPEVVRAFGRGELPPPGGGAPVVPIRGPRRRV